MSQLTVNNLACVRGDRLLFKNMSFALSAGELLYVRGENGAGKSSLLRILSGMLIPEQGSVLWDGRDVINGNEQYRLDSLFISHLNGLKDDLTLVENLRFSSYLATQSSQASQISDALGAVKLEAYAHERVGSLSQGQRRRISLARLWLSRARLWLLDEPFSALDVASVDLLAKRLQQHLQDGGMAILTTHQHVDIQAAVVHELKIAR
ncbi:cytochrome c biogenesis heme-transporting ATPase CcmA [Methylobacillus gramineus]|uniref:cytochrome c biogenesis heme-transporting ATPase CcmA n=1 Tax=Methylobacillus gramineus TaxID=755169 RepID=UPI001D0014C2|nr:cytochrome c biogenesis heme-transporting ATPase CcmA [Methylobacillus gramineus]MCB5183617.1 cytochrome c biogenesis heme-transporting ATPase CcmA [Methylobacillus gramineus]